jgi:hypothetical protein
MLRQVARVLVLGVLCAIVASAQSHALRSTWRAPGVESFDFSGRKVAAVVISSDESLRVSGEEALARQITARGPQGVAAYRTIPREVLEDAAEARAWFERTGVSGVVTMRVVSIEKETSYSSVTWTTSFYQSFSNYYMTSWRTVIPLGRREDTVVAVETMLYDVSDGKLLWGSVSESTNPRQIGVFMEGLVGVVVQELQDRGLVRATR